MADCIFCRIARGEVPARKVYEDEHAVAFLDAQPLARGHTLVVPRAHAEHVEDMSDLVARHVFGAAHKLAGRVAKAAGAEGTTIAVNNGKAAGQEVPHVHVHIVPRWSRDKAGPIHAMAWERPKVAPEELDQIATSIRALP
ncbi:MAG TPA: HIT family protein [Candidatus Thermoplasmatota archaeon]|jgi:histidine triad (HIT) family protein|nr:HIT family protein [Candidatus Thermoplasmatota archaeon]